MVRVKNQGSKNTCLESSHSLPLPPEVPYPYHNNAAGSLHAESAAFACWFGVGTMIPVGGLGEAKKMAAGKHRGA